MIQQRCPECKRWSECYTHGYCPFCLYQKPAGSAWRFVVTMALVGLVGWLVLSVLK